MRNPNAVLLSLTPMQPYGHFPILSASTDIWPVTEIEVSGTASLVKSNYNLPDNKTTRYDGGLKPTHSPFFPNMIQINLLIVVFLALAGTVWLYQLYRRFMGSTIKDLVGPPADSWLYGNMPEYFQAQACVKDLEWKSMYGEALRLEGPFRQNYLLLLDPKALQYVTQTAGYRYPKHRERKAVGYMLGGPGLVWADGDHHKRQRRVMLPGFGAPEAKALLPIFITGASKMVSIWKDVISDSGADQASVLDVHWYVSRATLDIIGEAAFEYDFGAQDNSNNALARAYSNIFFDTMGNVTKNIILFMSILQFVPEKFIYWFFDNSGAEKLKHAKATAELSESVSRQLLKEKTEALLQGEGSHDILSLIVKANAAEDLRSKMTETDMIAQLRTIMIAGHDTTANSVSWIMLELCRHPHIQDRLRQEIREMEKKKHRDDPWTSQELESMEYLTAIVKEGLRFHAVVPMIEREAAEDDIIPLSKPIVTTKGEVLQKIPIQKGQKIMLSIAGYNRNKDIFGEDADIFNPDRWLNRQGKPYVGGVGVYANMMSFSGGTRSCIGWRFAVLELQALLVEIISNFELSLSPEARKIRREPMGVMAPVVDGQVEKGTQLPLMVRMAPREDEN